MSDPQNSVPSLDRAALAGFFDWLIPNLVKLFDGPELCNELSERLEAVCPPVRWEVGPSDDDTLFFAFSPAGQKRLLPLTEAMANAAPAVPGWHFLPARPRKKWISRSFEYTGSAGSTHLYECDGWLYFLTAFNNGEFFDVNLVPQDAGESPEDLQDVGYLLVEFELGEKMFIEFIDRVNIITVAELPHQGNRIETLRPQLLGELAKHPRH